ncbi:DUF1684 domain-containing protein [Actinopolymorpha alba]|uniref:DUF1684 domain-containing protein n=1 Tax=Actinopolymorpha alba TaxID=533267 RepID=UPI00036ECD21|nr:DUF1684 domain-containing protein [Actinopolymorpha alba]
MGFAQDWKEWHQERERSAAAPYSMLALVGTFWIDDATTVPEVPGMWSVDEQGVMVKGRGEDGLVVDGEVVDGTSRPRSDRDPRPSTISHGDWKLALIERSGRFAVRVYDPHATTRTSFGGIEAFPPEEPWAVPATYTAYAGEVVVTVPNADGYDRDLALSGEVRFVVNDQALTLRVSRRDDGLHAVFSDRTSGDTTFRFRFLNLPVPDVDGATLIDFNRAYLPPCAFTDHYLCPYPPEDNALPLAVTAGEKAIRRRR